MEKRSESQKAYLKDFKNIIKELSKSNLNVKVSDFNKLREVELDREIIKYGIFGRNINKLTFSEKEMFVELIKKENEIKAKISENYNTEYFVGQERRSLQRKLRYEVEMEISKLKSIVSNGLEDNFKQDRDIDSWENNYKNIEVIVIDSEQNFDKVKINEMQFKRDVIRNRLKETINDRKSK